jgi:nitrate/nitrite-specific signal transduction histidine kinase
MSLHSSFSPTLEAAEFEGGGILMASDRTPSLGQAFAAVRFELGIPFWVEVRVVVDGRQRIVKARLRGEIYGIVRDAIATAYRRSRADSIEVEIEYRPTELRIAVRDNGCGIDSEKLQGDGIGYWGFQTMSERAEQIGARLRILSRVTLGTEVILQVPGRIAFEQA